MKKNDRQRFLDKRHSFYCHYGQEVSERDLNMAERGHPLADDYRTLFKAWDNLRYCSGSGERYIAFKDERNCITWGDPSLELPDSPTVDYSAVAELVGIGPVYPNHDSFLEYVAAVAAAGWPAICKPSLNVGWVYIHTTDYRIAAKAFIAIKGSDEIKLQDGLYTIRVRPWMIGASEMLALLAAATKLPKAWRLPQRDMADRIADAIPLAFEQKQFTLSGVNEVTETDHLIMVPLVPIGDTTAATVIAEDLLALCRRGYPCQGEVRNWLTKFIGTKTMKQLDKEFAVQTAGVK
jgi:hypothetical protein